MANWEKRAQERPLRDGGASVREIATTFGVSVSTAHARTGVR